MKVERIGPDRRLAGAERIVGVGAGPRPAAARRFLEAADRLGMDLSNMWGVMDAGGKRAKQVCLAVVGSGRTAMLFVSGPDDEAGSVAEDPEQGLRERCAVIRTACDSLGALERPGTREQAVVLAQALLEQEEVEALTALTECGFQRLGDLAYLRRPIPRSGGQTPRWPAGIVLQRLRDTPGDMTLLAKALERTYEQTMDCPELCGMRVVGDVLESHRSVGVFDPGMWWLVMDNGEPEGCMLLSACPEQNAVELVYLGLSPRLRGRGLGSSLLMMGVQSLTGRAEKMLTCAVDTRNAPAMALYRRCGFQRFAVRVPLVLSLRRGAIGTA
jgi:ribosomal protein S18 acetylase RimI-like enzyme